MFYVLIFGILAVVLVVSVLVTMRGHQREEDEEAGRHAVTKEERRKRKGQRAQSRQGRRKRH
jgi:hypothetical protein